MGKHFGHGEPLPPELEEVAELLRDERHRATPLELDQIKLRTKRRAFAQQRGIRGRAGLVRRQVLTIAIAVGMVVAGGGAAIAMSGHFVKRHHTASAAWVQYKPPCPPKHPKGKFSKSSTRGRAAWKHEPCKPPPKPPPCSVKSSKAHAAGNKPGCKPSDPGNGTTTTTLTENSAPTVNTQAPALVPNVQTGVTPKSSVNAKHKAKKKHRAKKHAKKKHAAKKHSSKNR